MDNRFEEMLKLVQVPETYSAKSAEYKYWFRSLIQKVDSSIDFSGLPDEWPEDFFRFCLWYIGYVAIFDTQRWGLAFQPCTLQGFDFYYQPTMAMVANPSYTKNLKIGKECEILKLTNDFRGILDIVDHYAQELAEISKGVHIGLVNAKVPMILTAKNSAQSQTLKAVYDQVQQGETLIVYKELEDNGEIIPSKDPFEAWNQDFKQTYIVSTLLDDMQKIIDQFYKEIGLPVSLDKKSHVLSEEAGFQEAQSAARIKSWKLTMDECLEKINTHFGTNISVEVTSDAYQADNTSDRTISE